MILLGASVLTLENRLSDSKLHNTSKRVLKDSMQQPAGAPSSCPCAVPSCRSPTTVPGTGPRELGESDLWWFCSVCRSQISSELHRLSPPSSRQLNSADREEPEAEVWRADSTKEPQKTQLGKEASSFPLPLCGLQETHWAEQLRRGLSHRSEYHVSSRFRTHPTLSNTN